MLLNSIVLPSSQISNIFTLNEFLLINININTNDNSISNEDLNVISSENINYSIIEENTINENLKNYNINHDFVYNIPTSINNIKLINFLKMI